MEKFRRVARTFAYSLVLVVMLSGCGSATPSPSPSTAPSPGPDFVWRLPLDEDFGLHLNVYDEAGLLVGIRYGEGSPFITHDIEWAPVPEDEYSLQLAWIGGACVDPDLHITGGPSAIRLAVSTGPPPGTCPAVGIAYALVLTFSLPVATLNASVSLDEAPYVEVDDS
jgi:hypothetical protein